MFFWRNIFGRFLLISVKKNLDRFFDAGKNFGLKNVIDLVKGQCLRDSL